mmetsp:Transcript_33493/g.53863  ORF Transcript_33493/g.53863 Transcript_33493/m.53863 type:complete len:89 (-) Transcript_33493:120-386(-)
MAYLSFIHPSIRARLDLFHLNMILSVYVCKANTQSTKIPSPSIVMSTVRFGRTILQHLHGGNFLKKSVSPKIIWWKRFDLVPTSRPTT